MQHSPTTDLHNPQHQQVIDAQAQANNAPLSPHFANPPLPSPPPAASGVRRHVSLTYGAAVGASRKVATATGLKRAGTVQGAGPTPAYSQNSSPPDSAGHAEEDEDYSYEQEDPSVYEDDYYFRQQQFTNTSIGRSSPWSSNNEWRSSGSTGPGNGNGNIAVDDVQRALSALELASNPQTVPQGVPYGNYQQPTNQSTNPPRFNTTQPSLHQPTGSRGSNGNGGNNNYNNGNGNKMSSTDFDGRKTPLSQQQQRGGGYIQQQRDDRGQAPSGNSWDQQRDQGLRGRGSNPNMQYGYQQGTGHTKSGSGNGTGNGGVGSVPSVPPIPQQYLQQQGQGAGGRPGLGVATSFNNQSPPGQTPVQAFVSTPIDVPSLIATKGYNPSTFETRPQFARFFVIKSYTEDDVHKSLKYEIWSSTDPGNKRLDKAFKDTAGRGPIYLFFSVNTSGHFCGMAEMLTPVSFIFVLMHICVDILIV